MGMLPSEIHTICKNCGKETYKAQIHCIYCLKPWNNFNLQDSMRDVGLKSVFDEVITLLSRENGVPLSYRIDDADKFLKLIRDYARKKVETEKDILYKIVTDSYQAEFGTYNSDRIAEGLIEYLNLAFDLSTNSLKTRQ